MDSNENSEEKTVDATNDMEVEEPNAQVESEKQPVDANMTNVVAEEDKTDETKDSTSAKSDEAENATASSEKLDDEKINTPPAEPSVAEEEKKDNEESSDISETAKDADKVQEDPPTPAVTPVTPVTPKETRRKRKSTNPSPETSATPLPPSQPATATEAEEQNGSSSSSSSSSSSNSPSKRKKLNAKHDKYCWRCHKESVEAQCTTCPRSWHRRCMGGAPPLSTNDWQCGECIVVQEAENAETRSPAMAHISIEQLCMMLKHVVERMRDQHGSEPFWKAVDLEDVPNYLDYVVKPMDLGLLESNIRAKLYGSTDAFMADAKWIQHNCIVFNTYTSKLTNTAKQMLKVARSEVSEIETCPDCFARGRNLPKPLPSWFIEPCRRPHPIVWAKLKGFPFWPAKAMSRLNAQGLVDVRFFGEHDRAWVSPKDIYLYSREPPAMLPKKKKLEMEECVTEVEEHIEKLKAICGEFRYASLKTPYDAHDPLQIKALLPNYDPSKSINTDSPKTNKSSKQTTPVQSPVNNKVTTPKTEKKTPILKNAVVAITNGIVDSAIAEKRKLDRKRKLSDPLEEVVNKETPKALPEVVIISHKSKSKSPPVTAVVTNKSSNENKSNSSASNPEPIKKNKSPEVSVIEVTNDSTPNKIITAARKLKSDSFKLKGGDGFKKIKLVKYPEKEDLKQVVVASKNTNGKPPAVIKVYRQINNLQNSSDAANDVSPNKKAKTVYNVQSKTQMATGKVVAKNALVEHKLASKVNKEVPRIVVSNIQKISKNGALSNKPMTAIPISSRPDQVKAMFSHLDPRASESAKHSSEKDARSNSTVPVIKQEPKEDSPQPNLTIIRKSGKARKSLPNRAPTLPSMVTPGTSRPLAKVSSNAIDSKVYIPPKARTSTFELAPAEAGPLSAKIHQGSKDLATRMAQFIMETIKSTADNTDSSKGNAVSTHEATIHMLKLRIERMKWEHQQEIADIRHKNDLVLRELKASMEIERVRSLQVAEREAELERQRCIEETKRKQWCVVCGREAMFYCCWNTAYCDYPCQQKHWSSHIATCAQKSQKSSSSNTSSSQPQQPKPVSETTANGQQNGNISDEIQT